MCILDLSSFLDTLWIFSPNLFSLGYFSRRSFKFWWRQIYYFFYYNVLCILSKEALPTPRLQRLSHVPFLKSDKLLGFTFRLYIVHFKLIFSHDVRYKSHFFPPYRYPILVPCIEKFSFSNWITCHLFQKLHDPFISGLFLFHYLYDYFYATNKLIWLCWLYNKC